MQRWILFFIMPLFGLLMIFSNYFCNLYVFFLFWFIIAMCLRFVKYYMYLHWLCIRFNGFVFVLLIDCYLFIAVCPRNQRSWNNIAKFVCDWHIDYVQFHLLQRKTATTHLSSNPWRSDSKWLAKPIVTTRRRV